jgi:hypothetical protein
MKTAVSIFCKVVFTAALTTCIITYLNKMDSIAANVEKIAKANEGRRS